MKMKFVSGLFLLLVFAAVNVPAAPKADFNGKWMLDADKSEGLPKGMAQVMTIEQNGDALNVTTKVYPANDGLAGLGTDIYDLTGKETKFVAQRAGVPGEGKRKATWAEDRKGFNISEEAVVELKQGAVKTETTRRWTLSDDGKMITIEIVTKDPQQGEIKSKRIFVKK